MIIPLNFRDIVLEPKARGVWCRLPYIGHPKGCPNYGKRETCPPKAPKYRTIVNHPYYLIAFQFDLEIHTKRMKELHPSWSNRKARCLLYWQGSVKKKLRDEALSFISSQEDDWILLETPEANGVDVFKTCERVGLILEKNPRKIVWKILIIGKRKKSNILNK
ncbi:MAG: hypothetical protein L6N96_06545 [Candidatus Methylarchaceae archaeon HK02M2]|nr:hypothetical protein [Candidatus Methylarchaceae archaeon HK02M2]